MSVTSSHLRYALKRIAKASSHPNVLVYKTQLEDAGQKYLVRETGNGGIALPPPSSATIPERGTALKELTGAKIELACEGKNMLDLKTVAERPWEAAANGGVQDITGRRFMGLAILDNTNGVGFLWEGTKSA